LSSVVTANTASAWCSIPTGQPQVSLHAHLTRLAIAWTTLPEQGTPRCEAVRGPLAARIGAEVAARHGRAATLADPHASLCLNIHLWIGGHHIIHWPDGGATELDNLVDR
jgi:hypothetical protein